MEEEYIVNFVSRLVLTGTFVASAALFATNVPLSNTGTIGSGCIGTVTLASGCSLMSNGQLGDTHYSLSGPAGSTTRARSGPGTPTSGPWIGDNSTSTWIAPNNGGLNNNPIGFYTYTQSFNLNFVPSPGSLILGRWASDNQGTLSFNGNVVSSTPAAPINASFSTWTPFTINSGFVLGMNTLTFTVRNTTVGATGLRVEFSQVSLPEPVETFTALALCGLVFVAARRRKAQMAA
ncbi:hypothetical protein F183_A54860 (plasmid) [Bryobacterales bacterium F-183]|nr:hypothetical protein F183_A54860 [Bryobacterales bacterium F-183]